VCALLSSELNGPQVTTRNWARNWRLAAGMLWANVLRQLVHESSLLAPDFFSLRRQESTFIVFNQVLLAGLLLTNIVFRSYFGNPPPLLVAILCVGFLANAFEWVWIRGRTSLSSHGIVALTWATIASNMAIALALATFSYRQDIQYFTLLIGPILQAAFRLSFGAMLLTVFTSGSVIIFWVWNYFRLHPPSDANEYIEAGTIAVIYAVAGVLVWTLVNHLRTKQTDLAMSMVQLDETKARLVMEERLAAVGRFSSAIAHEIRNPVAMISSALGIALDHKSEPAERQEMFDIAASEAGRLERLTTGFLAYARPRSLVRERSDVADSIGYIADVCRPLALERVVNIRSETRQGLYADIDGDQLQQALLNLAINAIEASPPNSDVVLRGRPDNKMIRIEVENDHGPIPPATAKLIFEPFFTTKSSGTGLGLAITRSIVLSHGADLVLTRNEPGLVQFSILLPTTYTLTAECS
jgi:signal transduction histidine kinase